MGGDKLEKNLSQEEGHLEKGIRAVVEVVVVALSH